MTVPWARGSQVVNMFELTRHVAVSLLAAGVLCHKRCIEFVTEWDSRITDHSSNGWPFTRGLGPSWVACHELVYTDCGWGTCCKQFYTEFNKEGRHLCLSSNRVIRIARERVLEIVIFDTSVRSGWIAQGRSLSPERSDGDKNTYVMITLFAHVYRTLFLLTECVKLDFLFVLHAQSRCFTHDVRESKLICAS